MISSWVVQLGTVTALAVGFGLGWLIRGWRDRELALEELKKRGIEPEDLS